MISIIIPVYNVERYLDQCLLSVLNQTYTDWECILVEDGSKDESPMICDSWVQRDSRFKVIHQQNQGVSAARNYGLEVVKGEFTCFIDSDDWVDSDYLQTIYENLSDVDYSVSGIIMEYPEYTQIHKPHATRTIYIGGADQNIDDLVEEGLLYGPVLKLFKSDIIRKSKILFPKNKVFGEDLEFNFRYLTHCKKLRAVNYTGYHYRILQTTNLSSKFREDQFVNDFEQWTIQYDFYNKHNLLTPFVKRWLYRRQWGQTYDGLFLYPKIKSAGIGYIREVLSLPDMKEMRIYKNEIHCAEWIKQMILHRCSFVLFSYFEIKKLLCR